MTVENTPGMSLAGAGVGVADLDLCLDLTLLQISGSVKESYERHLLGHVYNSLPSLCKTV